MKSGNQVLITSVFSIPTLPKVSSLTSRKSLQRRKMNSPTIRPQKNISKISNDRQSRNNKTEETNRNRIISEHFKDKLYEDVSLQSLSKLKHKIVFNDKYLLKKVLHMKKFASFWKCFCDYTNPIISIEKFKNEAKIINERHHKIIPQLDTLLESKHKPRLYTNSSIFASHHKKKIEQEKEFYEKIRYNGF